MKRAITIVLQLVAAIVAILLVNELWEPLRRHFPKLPEWSAAELVAFLAIAFAIVQFLDAKLQELALERQGKKLEAQANELTEIARSMSTRYVGMFPENLKEITRIISDVNKSLSIIVDFVSYGQYSSPALCAAYLQAIENARHKNAEVRIICYGPALCEDERQKQFPDGRFAQQENPAVFERYFMLHSRPPRPRNNAELRSVLTGRDHHNRSHLLDAGASVRIQPQQAAFFLWLRDEQEAVFTFKNVGSKDVGFSFSTRDLRLVRQFGDIFERRWESALESSVDSAEQAK